MQRVDPGLPDPVNRRQVAVLQSMAHELGGQASPPSAATLALPSSMLVHGLPEWVANHSAVDEAVIRGFLRDVSAYLELPGSPSSLRRPVEPAPSSNRRSHTGDSAPGRDRTCDHRTSTAAFNVRLVR